MENQLLDEKQAEEFYNSIMDLIEPMLGNSTTYMRDLDRIGKKILKNKYKGTFSSDMIPRLSDEQPYCILNLDRSDQPGSHWIAMCKDNSRSIIYDSFGRPYNTIVQNLDFSKNGRIIDTDLDAEQHENEENCGLRSMAWLILCDLYGPENGLLI